jgi:hypothetical protein
MVDGKRFEPSINTVTIQNVDAGFHSVRIFREKASGSFGLYENGYDLVYDASVPVRRGTNVIIVIDEYGKANVSVTHLRGRDRDDDWGDNSSFDYNRDGQPVNYDRDRNWNEHGDDNSWNDNSDIDYIDYSRAMTGREFNQVMSSMQKEWYEGNRIKSASFIISNNFFTADQVSQLISLFRFDNYKLELAKQAYAKTVNKINYNIVADELSYSSRDQLAHFISTCR